MRTLRHLFDNNRAWANRILQQDPEHETQLNLSGDNSAMGRRLCELNVIEQVLNVCQTTIVQDAWQRRQQLAVHGLIYAIEDGLLRDLNTTIINK